MIPDNQRRSSRFSALVEQNEATLEIGGATISARLLDESAGGFGLLVPLDVAIATGQIGQLEFHGGYSRVRVGNRVDQPDGARLGLERLEDMEGLEDIEPTTSPWRLALCRLPLPRGTYTNAIVGLLIVGGLLLAILAGDTVLREGGVLLQWPEASAQGDPQTAHGEAHARKHHRRDLGGSPDAQHDQTKMIQQTPSSLLLALQRWVGQRMNLLRQATGDAGLRLLRFRLVVADWTKAVEQTTTAVPRHATGDQSLLTMLPKLVDNLQLTAEQRQRIDAIFRQSREATQGVYRHARDLGFESMMRDIDRIRRDANEQLKAELSTEQLEQLDALTDHPRPEGEGGRQ